MKKQQPPPTKKFTKIVDWATVVAACTVEPGEWFLVGEFSEGLASHLRVGRYKHFYPEGTKDPAAYMKKRWEFTARKVEGSDPPRVDLYVRALP